MRVTREQGDLCRFFSTLTGLTALQVGGLKVQDSELNVIGQVSPTYFLALHAWKFANLALNVLKTEQDHLND